MIKVKMGPHAMAPFEIRDKDGELIDFPITRVTIDLTVDCQTKAVFYAALGGAEVEVDGNITVVEPASSMADWIARWWSRR